MKHKMMDIRKSALVLLLVFGAMVSFSLVLPGCTDFLDDKVRGDITPNEKPVVYFVNIPPDGTKVSINPAVHWVGSDKDGLVMMFRYVLVTEDEMGGPGADPTTYAAGGLMALPESRWTYLDVTVDDPQTTNIVAASADLDDPVNSFVPQYIFVQAYDDLGAVSDVVWLMINRNDYPPDTEINTRFFDESGLYINAAQPGGVNTGVRIRWSASDPDFEDSLFEYEWKVFGPYMTETFDEIVDEFQKPVFLSNDANLYYFGQGSIIYIVDTTYDTAGIVIDTIDTIYIDTVTGDNFYGTVDTILDLNDEDFVGNPDYFLPVDSSWNGVSTWVTNERDSLYNLFRNYPLDTTGVMKFIFTVRCRDEAQVADLIPDWVSMTVIEPKYERDVFVIDFSSKTIRMNAPYILPTDTNWKGLPALTAMQYWKNTIEDWNPAVDFDVTRDYLLVDTSLRVSMKVLLQHKLIILYNDDISASGISSSGLPSSGVGDNIYTAIDAGVNAWLTMRAPIVGRHTDGFSESVNIDPSYRTYFGVDEMPYSAWGWNAFQVERILPINGGREVHRIEDFIGATSMNTSRWPDLKVDSILLHDRYFWDSSWFYRDDPYETFYGWGSPFKWGGSTYAPIPQGLRALPEVNWASRVYGTEVMYLYESYYGSEHFMGPLYSFDGAPVAHNLNTGLYKTVHFCFTPLAMDSANMRVVVHDVLNWLYEPNLFAAPTEVRYPDAKVRTSIAEARKQYWDRFYQKADERKVRVATGLSIEEW